MKRVASAVRKINLTEIVEKSIVNNDTIVLDLNTSQLYSGVGAEGQDLGTYTAFTQRAKRAKGQPTDRVTLYDEGDFYKGFTLKNKKFPFEIDSTDSKSGMLEDKYGDIFGLTNESTSELSEQILDEVQESFYKEVESAFRLL